MTYRMKHLRGDLRGLPLSRREQDVLVARVNVGSDEKAARRLGIALPTFHTYLANARMKLGAQNTPHAAALAYRRLSSRYSL